MRLPAATLKLMDADVARVRALHAAALAVAASARGDAGAAVLKQVKDQGVTLEKWATTWRQWAEAGAEPDGYPYPLEHWRRIGQDLADFFAFASKQARYTLASTTTMLVDAVAEAGKTVKEAVTPSSWSLTAKLIVGGAAVLVALVLLNKLAGSSRAAAADLKAAAAAVGAGA